MQPDRPVADTTVAVAWDQSSRTAYSLVTFLAGQSDGAVGLDVPGLERQAVNLLDDIVVPSLRAADRVLVLWSPNDPLWVGFQAGLAAGLGKPSRVIASTAEAPSARGLPVGVASIDGPTAALAIARGKFGAAKPTTVEDGRVFLCPRETDADRTVLAALQAELTDRPYRRVGARTPTAVPVDDVVWVVTPHEVSGGHETNLRPNLGNAYEAGRCYGAALRAGTTPTLRILRVGVVPPIPALDHLTDAVPDAAAAAHLLAAPRQVPLRLSRVVLTSLKCFEHIEVPISTESPLGGAWTCIAGVNGAGKSTVLQAIALGLLGRSSAVELGLARIGRMVRRRDGRATKAAVPQCEIRLTLVDGSSAPKDVILPLGPNGVDDRRLASLTDRTGVEQSWERLRSTLIVSYGATRNISDTPTSASATPLSSFAQRQLTLFDPLGQIVSAEALASGGEKYVPMLRTVAKLVTALLDEPDRPFACEVVDGQLRFHREGSTLGSLDLPDGFRSILSLLADIAAGWHELHPDAVDVDPTDIDGMVLVDELDLHLHARLQRLIVPRLRRALPNVQWIVTTHSPFIVGSFDQTEIVLLDRDAEGGIRTLDRQVLAFSANEIYEWLLEARPVSEAGEEEMAKESGTALLYQSPDRSEARAEQLVAQQSELLAKLKAVKAD